MAFENKDVCIGIDLGTTYTCVALLGKHGQVEVLANEHGERTTPSYVAFIENQILIGKPAKVEASIKPKQIIFDVKRLIGRKYGDKEVQNVKKHWPFNIIEDNGNPKIVLDIPNDRKTFLPEEVSALVLRYVKDIATKYVGQEVRKAVITVPAYFNDSQRDATKRAGEIAGLEVLRIVNEPTAAGIAYGFRNKEEKKKNVLVFDLGGGTFDVSILTIGNGVFEVIATAGDSHLGGDDFDNNIVDYFMELLKNKHKIDISNNNKAKIRLRAKCEEGKRNLTRSTVTRIVVDDLVSNFDFQEKLTRNKFDDLNKELYVKLRKPIDSALNDANLEKEAIDDVVLIGGSSRILSVQMMINNMFASKVRQDINTDEAVAYGAAIVAAYLNGETHELFKDFHFKDVTTLSLGLETVGGEMAFFIRRNMPLPQTKTRWFTTNRDSQSSVCFVVYEGERLIAKENNRLGEFVISGIETGQRDAIQIKVTLTINFSGVLEVTATESLTGKTNDLKIENVGRLSEVETRKMTQDAIRFREDDLREKERIDAKLAVEDCCNRIIDSHNPDENILSQCQEILRWMKNNEEADVEQYTNKLQEIKSSCGPLLERLLKK